MQSPLEQIYRKNRQALFTFAMSITRCESAAEDRGQQAFVRLNQTKPNVDDLLPYVYRAVKNSAIDPNRLKIHQESIFTGYVLPPARLIENPGEEKILSKGIQAHGKNWQVHD